MAIPFCLNRLLAKSKKDSAKSLFSYCVFCLIVLLIISKSIVKFHYLYSSNVNSLYMKCIEFFEEHKICTYIVFLAENVQLLF